ncbi:MAG: hypothetical protein M5U12_35245 [Verrucomicrobia bacterium]|nr:hypothetical protein [Verrucomicrobiota bacterium]
MPLTRALRMSQGTITAAPTTHVISRTGNARRRRYSTMNAVTGSTSTSPL